MPRRGKARTNKPHSVVKSTPGPPTASSSNQPSSEATRTPKLSPDEMSDKTRKIPVTHRAQGPNQGHNEQLMWLKDVGNDHFKSGDYPGAKLCYLKALETCGPHPTLFANLAAVSLKMEQYGAAAAYATSTLQYEPNNLKARYRRGVAQRELKHYRTAIADFQIVLQNDPTCTEAMEQLSITKCLLAASDDESDDDEWYCDDDDCGCHFYFDDSADDYGSVDLDYESDSSDYRHEGNGIPCKYYNHNGCSNGRDCSYSHAPDGKSERDALGKNVCLFFLLGRCRYGESKCVYSHDKSNLPPGWWDDEEFVAQGREIFDMPGANPAGPFLQSFKRPTKKTSDGWAPLATRESSNPGVPTKSFILLLTLEANNTDDDFKRPLYNCISSHVPLIKTVAEGAMSYLSSSHLTGVLVPDGDIAKRKHARILARLVEFVKAGGTVVLGGSFSTFFPLGQFDSFFGKTWGVPWQEGSYHRTTFRVNSSNELVKANPSLSPSYSMKALHVKNFAVNDAIYRPSSDSRIESRVFAPSLIDDLFESPAVYTLVGKGHLGYIGDVNWEDGSTKVILAMFGLHEGSDPSPAAQPSSSTAPQEPSKNSSPLAKQTAKETTRPAAETSGSNSKPGKPFVLLLSLQHETFFAEIHEHLLTALTAKAEWTQAFDAATAITHLSSPHLAGVLVTDPGIVEPEHMAVASKLVEFVKSGGSVVIGGLFSTFVRWNDMDTFFKSAWGLKWKGGPYHRTTFSVNQSHGLAKRNPSLAKSYSMKALHLASVERGDAVYLPTDESRIESMVLPPDPVRDLSESPAVQTRIEKGYFGYIGDVNGEVASTNVVLAMLGLLDRPNCEEPSVTPMEAVSTNTERGLDLQALSKPKPEPFIMTLSFGNEAAFLETQTHLCSALSKEVEVHHTLSIPRVLDLLSSPDLIGVLITDVKIIDDSNAYLVSQLVGYTKAGGRVVFGGFFASLMRIDRVKPFFQNWGMDWDSAAYTSVEMVRNRRHELVKANANAGSTGPGTRRSGADGTKLLPGEIHITALHLSGVGPDDAVYVAKAGTHLHERGQVTKAAVVYAKVGEGWLGYIGDVGLVGEGHTKIVLAMFGLLRG